MKKIKQIREQYDLITEKEEAETRKLTSLVRAGLFDLKKLPMLKRALNKDPKDMTPAERKILIELLDSLMGEVLQSQQVYSKVKQNVMMKEEKDFEFEMARSELKALIADAQKILSNLKGEGNLEAWVQSKITKAADYINAAADNIEHSDEKLDEAVGKTFDGYYSKYDPRYTKMPSEREIPTVIILKRKAIRIYPDNQKVALYYSQALDKYVTIPFGTFEGSASMNEAAKPGKPKDEEKHQELMKRIAAAQALRDKATASDAQKEKVDSLTTELPAKSKKRNEADRLVKKKKDSDKEEKNKTNFYDKKLTSKMDIGRAKVLMKRDPEIGMATRLGTLAGLAARRAFDNSKVGKAFYKARSSYKIAKNQAKNINTAFEESETRSKFYEKRQKQLDEYITTPVNPGVAGRVGVSPRVGSRPGTSTSGTSTFSLKKKYENPFVDTEKVEDLLKKKKSAPAKAKEQSKVKDWSKSFSDTETKPPVEIPRPSAPPEAVPEPAPKRVMPTEVPSPSAPPEAVPETTPKRSTPIPMPSAQPEAVPAPAIKPAETQKTEPKSDTVNKTKSDTKTDRKSKPERRRGGLGRTAGTIAAIAAAAAAGFDVAKRPTEQNPFTLKVKTSKPVGTIRTGVEARDASVFRRTMQQNESVLNTLYSINENEEKLIEIANESVVINTTVAKKIIGLYESVNKNNKDKIESMLNESVDSFKKIASFAARQ